MERTPYQWGAPPGYHHRLPGPREVARCYARERPVSRLDPSEDAMSRNVFVIGLDEPNRELLNETPAARECEFHPLVDFDDLRGVETFPVDELLEKGERDLDAFPGPIDAITTCIDFPATEFVPLLGRRHGTTGPTIEGVLACNHKYWSRQLQRAAAPEAVPDFAVLDPYVDDPLSAVDLDPPMWVKPLNAFRSHLGFRIAQPQDLYAALPVIREELPRLAAPFDAVLKHAELPPEIEQLGANVCLAEQIISGRLCTVEGYVRGGQPHIYGIVDSVRAPNRTSFARYQYPSSLPPAVQRRIRDTAERVMATIGLDDSPFNMELFHNARRDTLAVLEINPRISQSHGPLFHLVDGVSHHQVMVDIALGRQPDMPHRGGPYNVAAKFFLRAYRDARVTAVPSDDDIARLVERLPGTKVHVLVEEGTQLSDLTHQDSYSYELAEIYLGGKSVHDLLARWHSAREELGFGLEDPE